MADFSDITHLHRASEQEQNFSESEWSQLQTRLGSQHRQAAQQDHNCDRHNFDEDGFA